MKADDTLFWDPRVHQGSKSNKADSGKDPQTSKEREIAQKEKGPRSKIPRSDE